MDSRRYSHRSDRGIRHRLRGFPDCVIKNAVGIVFLLAGIAMLFLPGQGLLTMLIGISLMDFPRKRQLEAKMVGQPTLLGVINNMRRKFDKPPLTLAPGP